ncbi:unnamed protein product, partial [Meganyctiphanes norvegica]
MEQGHGPDIDVCLIMENCISHPKMIEDLDPRVMLLFLPTNTTALIPSMGQGVISNFEVTYHNMMYAKLIEQVDNTPLDQQGEHHIVNYYNFLAIRQKGLGEIWCTFFFQNLNRL